MSNDELIKEQIKNLVTLFSSGQFKEVLKIASELLNQHSQNTILLNIVGACYAVLNQHNKAIINYQKAISIDGEYAEAHFNLAVAYQDINNLDESVKSYKKAIATKLGYCEAFNNLGNVYKSLGEINNAIESYQNAININEDYFEAHYNLGALYKELNQSYLAIYCYKKALKIRPNFAELHNNIAILYVEINNLDYALEHLKKAVNIKPDFSEAHNNLSNIYLETNQIDVAINGYERSLAINQNYAEAYFNLSKITKYSFDDKKIKQIHSMLNNPNISIINNVYLLFALAYIYEKLKINDKFIEFLNKANKLQSKVLNFSLNNEKRLFSKIKSLFPLKPISFVDNRHLRPIFIVGMPRSGTSLVEQIISSHHEVYGGGELTIMPNIIESLLVDIYLNNNLGLKEKKCISLREDYLSQLSSLSFNEKIITDKMPLNFEYIGFILSAFPEAKIISLNRNSIATCWSNYRCLFSDGANDFSYKFHDLVGFYKLYEDMMHYWHEIYPNKIYDISYEKLTDNQEEETRKLLDYCGLEWDENCMNFHNNKRAVKTASSLQVRKKMYQGSSEAWKEYEDYLQPLIENLNPS